MPLRLWFLTAIFAIAPLISVADTTSLDLPIGKSTDESRFFVGLDVSAGKAYGSSGSKKGGAPFAGGGIVKNLKFDDTTGLGGHIGYRFDPALSAFISYQHIQGDIGWNANFPMIGAASRYEGSATTNVVMGNLAYDFSLSDAASIRLSAGIGVAFNRLSSLVETQQGTGIFLAKIEDETKSSPAAQIGVGIRYSVASSIVLGLDALAAYTGGFETGDTRVGNLGVTDINPYKIDDVWRANIAASVRFEF